MKERLELEVMDFEVGAFKNNYRNAIFYFDNDEKGIIKKQAFINGTDETKFLLRELGADMSKGWSDGYDSFPGSSITLVFEKHEQGKVVAISNDSGDFTLIRDEYFDNGQSFLPDGNTNYFENNYGINTVQLTSLVKDAVQKSMTEKSAGPKL